MRTAYGAEIVGGLGPAWSHVAEIVHQSQELFDGTGYPQGLRGDAILREAQVLRAADTFDGLIHPRPGTSAPLSPRYAMQMLSDRKDKHYRADVVEAVIRAVGLFPVGTYVKISTGEAGQVLESRPENLLRPLVEVTIDSRRRKIEEPRTVDLMLDPHLYVISSLTLNDLEEMDIGPSAYRPRLVLTPKPSRQAGRKG